MKKKIIKVDQVRKFDIVVRSRLQRSMILLFFKRGGRVSKALSEMYSSIHLFIQFTYPITAEQNHDQQDHKNKGRIPSWSRIRTDSC